MRTCSLCFGFLSTYDYTVFVKRAADSSFLLSPPIKHDAMEPSLRQLFAGFVLMALSEPKYFESPSFQPRDVSIDSGNCERYGVAADISRSYEALPLFASPLVYSEIPTTRPHH
jgi:hypothetical protein